MKTLLTFFLALASSLTYGQFAVVHDKDGFCNVRSSAGSVSKIVDNLKNGHLVYCFETTSNWTNIDYRKNKKELNGYVYQDRVVSVSTYSTVPVLVRDNLKITLKKDSIKVVVSEGKFDKSQHSLSFFKGNKDQLELIDNKRYWGTDGGIPKREYKSIEILLGQTKLNLPKSAFDNLYEPSLYNTKVNYDQRKDILYIQSMNSDGAGGYQVIWKIVKGVYKERFVAYGF